MLNSISFHTPSQNTRAESTLATPQRSKPDTSLAFSTGPKKDHFQPHNVSLHFGSAMPPPGGGGDHFFRQTGHYYEPIPGYDQTQGLFLRDTAPQAPTYTRWRTLPAVRKKPQLLLQIDTAQAMVNDESSKTAAAKSVGIQRYWLNPPSDQKIEQAERLLSTGTPQTEVAKKTSMHIHWLTGLVANRPVGLNNPELQDRINEAKKAVANGKSQKKAAEDARISHNWFRKPPKTKLTKAQQYIREGDTQAEAARKAGITDHWLIGERNKIKKEFATSGSDGYSSSTGLSKAVSRMELPQGRPRPKISSKNALAYFENEGILDPALNADEHAAVMGHIATYAYSYPAQKEDALNRLSAYSAAYNTRFPAVQHRLRTLGDELSGPAPVHSGVASGSHSSTNSDTSLFSSVDIWQISDHLPEVEVLGGTMYAHYDQSGNYMGHFNEPQTRK